MNVQLYFHLNIPFRLNRVPDSYRLVYFDNDWRYSDFNEENLKRYIGKYSKYKLIYPAIQPLFKSLNT